MEENDTVSLNKLIKSKLKKEGDEVMATAAQRLWNEGKQEGRQEGIQETAMRMLEKKLDIPIISSVTGLSRLQITKLKNSLKPKKVPIKMPVGKKNL